MVETLDRAPRTGEGERAPGGPPSFLAAAPATTRVAEALQRAAATDVRVVLYGEPGVGKSQAYRRLHALSRRRQGPLGRVSARNVRATDKLSLPDFLPSLVGGTLVLEGVDEAPAEVQSLLVGILEEWGMPEETSEAPVRIVATGQRDLLDLVEEGLFRKDLYYLLDVFPLAIPPLRQRPEEIPLFFEHFCSSYAPDREPPKDAESFLVEAVAYSWPGNLRELENVVRASIPLYPEDPWALPTALPRRGGQSDLLPFAQAKREFEQSYVRRILTVTGGNVTRAAEITGKARKDFYALMARNNIDPAQFRTLTAGG